MLYYWCWTVEGTAYLCWSDGKNRHPWTRVALWCALPLGPCWSVAIFFLCSPLNYQKLMHTSIGQDKLVIKKQSLCLPHQYGLFLQLQGMSTVPYSTWISVGKQQTCNLQHCFLRNECCCFYIVLEQKRACTLYSLFVGVKYCFIHVHFFLPLSKELTLAECFVNINLVWETVVRKLILPWSFGSKNGHRT